MATPTVREVLQGIAVGAALDLTTGAGTEATDLLLVTHSTHFYTLADMDPPTPGVWTLVTQADDGDDRVKTKVWARLAGSAGAQTITLPSVIDTHTFGRLRVLAGVDTSNPIDAAAGANGFGNGGQQDAPSVSPTSDDALLCCDWICDQELTYTAPAGMTPSGTQLQDFSTAFGAHEALTASGPTGVRTATLNGDASFAATSAAIRGASSAVVSTTGIGHGGTYGQATTARTGSASAVSYNAARADASALKAGSGGGTSHAGAATHADAAKTSSTSASGPAGGYATALAAKTSAVAAAADAGVSAGAQAAKTGAGTGSGYVGGTGQASTSKRTEGMAVGHGAASSAAVPAKLAAAVGAGAGGAFAAASPVTARFTSAVAALGAFAGGAATPRHETAAVASAGAYGLHSPTIAVVPGILTPGATRPTLTAGSTRPGLTPGSIRPLLTPGRFPDGQ